MRTPFMPPILSRLAARVNAKLLIEPEYGFVGLIIFPNGQRSFFSDNKFNLNPLSSVKIAQDKAYTSFFLRSLGYSVPEERTFFRERFRRHLAKSRGIEDAVRYAQEIGWPVFVKPSRLSQGRFVAKVHNRRELRCFARNIFKHDRVMIAQQACTGADYRVIILDNQVLSAYCRKPLCVTGDGRSSIFQLLEAKQAAFRAEGRDTDIPIDDQRIHAVLKRHHLKMESVLEIGDSVSLLDVANLSLGGTIEDVTSTLHSDYAELCIRVAHDMDLRFCGIDFVTVDAAQPLDRYYILEINSAPGLDNYRFSGIAQQEYVDELYLKVLQAIMQGPPKAEEVPEV